MMESSEEKRAINWEDTIFVAVGKNVNGGSRSTLDWAVRSFAGKKICLVHVLQPSNPVSFLDGKLLINKTKQQTCIVAQELERQKMHGILDEYLVNLSQKGVEAGKLWIEMDSIEKGIVEIINQHDIRWLVMGAASDKYYSKNMAELVSRKAIFVCKYAPISCHIWFSCKGRLIYTRERKKEETNLETMLPLLLLNSDEGTEPSVATSPVSVINRQKSLGITLENVCADETIQRKEMEKELERKKQEIETMKKQYEEYTKELNMIEEQRPRLENQITESSSVIKELEEKIEAAVGLLITLKERRDQTQIKHADAIEEVKKLKNLRVKSEPRLLKFTFSEIIEATNNFDPSRKIGEGRNGSIYRGILHHLHVAIKMLPSYGSQSDLEFQHEVEMLSKVRHPNLVTLIGTCPESRTLIYEYLQNQSLEDRISSKGNTQPLSWQTRIQISFEICSTLIFLHSNNPSIVHGDLKPSKILLGTNFVSKVNDLGISRLVQKNQILINTDPKIVESDIYSFGMIILQMLTGRPAFGVENDVKCALESGNINFVLDVSAGDWPQEKVKQLASLAMKCCEKKRFYRRDLLSEVWNVLKVMKSSCIESGSYLQSKQQSRIPSYFVCPIFQEVMKDPHIAADGFTYEAEAIEGWLNSGHDTSPMTNLKLSHCKLIPNYALHYAIQEWQQQW